MLFLHLEPVSGFCTKPELSLKKTKKQDKKTKIYKYDAWKYEDDSFRRNFIQDILSQSGLKQDNKVYKKIIESLYEDYSINFNSIIESKNLLSFSDLCLLILSKTSSHSFAALIGAK